MIVAASSFELNRTDGTKLLIELVPVTDHADGRYAYTGVYQLLATRQNAPTEAYTEENPGDTTEIGSFIHRQDNKYDWEYLGNFLDDEEQIHVAQHLQQLEDPDQHDDSSAFYVQAFSHGGMKSFEVKAREHTYTIATDGNIIAEIAHKQQWQQTSGEPLEEDVFVSIKQAIEGKFEN